MDEDISVFRLHAMLRAARVPFQIILRSDKPEVMLFRGGELINTGMKDILSNLRSIIEHQTEGLSNKLVAKKEEMKKVASQYQGEIDQLEKEYAACLRNIQEFVTLDHKEK